jgi:hypothetical protein
LWGAAFAVPSFYWAAGGLAGASSTVSPALVELAAQRDPGIVAALWLTGALKLLGAVLGLALARYRAWGPRTAAMLQLLACGAGVVLVWHGALFIGDGLLVQVHLIAPAPTCAPSPAGTPTCGSLVPARRAGLPARRPRRPRRSPTYISTIAAAGGALGGLNLSAAALAIGLTG